MMKKLLSLLVFTFISLSIYAQDSWKPYEGAYQGYTYLGIQPDPKTTGSKTMSTLTIDEQGLTLRGLKARTIAFKNATLSPIEVVTNGEQNHIQSHTWSYPLETADDKYYFSYSTFTIKEGESIITDKSIIVPFEIDLGTGRKLYGLFEGEKSITGIATLTTDAQQSEQAYDLWGRKAGNKQGGIVIVGGKKVLVK